MGDLLQKCKSIARSLKLARPSRFLFSTDLGLACPSRELADMVTTMYFRYFELTNRILYVPSFWDECWIRNRVHQWIHAAQAWLSGPLEKDRLDITGIQVHCLTILARQIFSVGGDLIWMSMGPLVHNYSSLDSAMPPRISFDEFDTQTPSNNNDDEMDESTTVLSPHPRTYYTSTSMQLVLLDSLPIRVKIVQLLNSLHSHLSCLDVLTLGSELNDKDRVCSNLMQENNASGVTTSHQNLLDCLVRRFLIPLHFPLAIKAQTNPLFCYSLKVNLDVAMATISPELDEAFSHLMAIGGGTFREGIWYASAVISLELITQVQAQRMDGTLHRKSQHTENLKQAMRDMISLSTERMRQGETNVRSHMFLSMIMAQVEAIETGTPCELNIVRSAVQSLRFCHGVLQDLVGTVPLRR
ncbi:hypothetical protein BDZ45DRAFT_716622 [Acephala macrosclerotiorum]|nr:hypothetical protein BDZ45DRAFT_716622 [Acephala macrosclerotiorum]